MSRIFGKEEEIKSKDGNVVDGYEFVWILLDDGINDDYNDDNGDVSCY